MDASWISSSLEQCWNAALPIVLRFLLQTTRSREVQCINILDDFEHIGESNGLEGGTALECQFSDSFEVFVAEDAFEGGATSKRHLLEDFELIGESYTREGDAAAECLLS